MLDPALVSALQDGTPERLLSVLQSEAPSTPLYSLPVFNDLTCKQLLEEVDSFEASGLPVMRPNVCSQLYLKGTLTRCFPWFCCVVCVHGYTLSLSLQSMNNYGLILDEIGMGLFHCILAIVFMWLMSSCCHSSDFTQPHIQPHI